MFLFRIARRFAVGAFSRRMYIAFSIRRQLKNFLDCPR